MSVFIQKPFSLFITVTAATKNNAFQIPTNYENLSPTSEIIYSLVNSIPKDYVEFLWIATKEGFNCFDGYDFNSFKNFHSDTSKILIDS